MKREEREIGEGVGWKRKCALLPLLPPPLKFLLVISFFLSSEKTKRKKDREEEKKGAKKSWIIRRGMTFMMKE